MGLQSTLFAGDPDLEACLIRDSAHVREGAMGDHVAKIQTALISLDGLSISDGELTAQRYGTSTAAAVLAFKKKRHIINPAYQTHEDKIVGKMTISALDREMRGQEAADMRLVNAANMRRLAALSSAELEILRLKKTFEPDVPDSDDPVVTALDRQLFVSLDSTFWDVTGKLLSMIRTNRATVAPFFVDKSDPNFAHVDPSNDPVKGVTLGVSFFDTSTSDNCRHEVVTHEFFHFIVGLQHFYSTRSNSEAMRCPHHLARAVFDIALRQQLAPCAATGNVCR